VQITFRQAGDRDFDYCAKLYFSGMEDIIRELKLDRAAQAASLRQEWKSSQVRVIVVDALDVGWFQIIPHDDALFLAQLFVSGRFQGRGIGTAVMNSLIDEGTGAGKAVALAVVKTNPALRLYRRLGFRVTHEDDRKFYMWRDYDAGHQCFPSWRFIRMFMPCLQLPSFRSLGAAPSATCAPKLRAAAKPFQYLSCDR
jgi:ribosomal protein S18 acetylase RimI-like enzyme